MGWIFGAEILSPQAGLFSNEKNNSATLTSQPTQRAHRDLRRPDILEHVGTALGGIEFVVTSCCNFAPCFRKSLIMKMERAKGFEAWKTFS